MEKEKKKVEGIVRRYKCPYCEIEIVSKEKYKDGQAYEVTCTFCFKDFFMRTTKGFYCYSMKKGVNGKL